MAGFVLKLLQACPTTQAVCTLTKLSWSTVNAIMVSAVERDVLSRTEEEIHYLGIDEKSSQRGHSYASILTDIDRSRVLDLVPERRLQARGVSLLETLTPTQRAAVKAVDATRRQKHRKLSQAGTSALTGSKWAWLKKYPNGRSAEAISFRALNQLNLKTSRAWCIKENFTQFWSYSFNSTIQLIKANARGFRNFTNYRARILFHCGKLDLAMA
jgi:transposase